MDGTISSLSAQSVKHLPLTGFSTSDHSLRSGLFEQLLNMPPPAAVPPAASCCPTESEDSSGHWNEAADSVSNSKSSADDEHDAAQENTEELQEDVDSKAAENQAALLTAALNTTQTATDAAAGSTLQAAKAPVSAEPENIASAEQHISGEDEPLNNRSDIAAAPQSKAVSSPEESATKSDQDVASELNPTTSRSASLPNEQATTGEDSNGANVSEQPTLENENPEVNTRPIDSEKDVDSAEEQLQAASQPAEEPTAGDDRLGRDRSQRREKWYEPGNRPSTAEGAADLRADNDKPASAESYERPGSDPSVQRAGLTNQQSAPETPQSADRLHAAASSMVPGTAASSLQGGSTSSSVASLSATLENGNGPTSGLANSANANSSSANSSSASGELSGSQSGSGVDGVVSMDSSNRPAGTEGKSGVATPQRTDNLTQAERVRVIQRISRSFARLGPTGGQINIKLHPPQLGSLNIQVRMEGRSMTAKLSTESSAARDTILQGLPVLRSRLAEQGFEIASFQVEVADSSPDTTSRDGQMQNAFGQTSDGEAGDPSRLPTDYRRLALQQRLRSEAIVNQVAPATRPELSWQMLAGIDTHA